MSDVPANIRPYVDVLGIEGAIDFFLTFGGAPIHLTERPNASSSVVAAVGIDQARALGRRFGAGYQRVPTAKPWIAQRLRANGESVNAIARRLHMTDKTVRTYLPSSLKQLDLLNPELNDPA